jgi:hypothetical protein
LETVLVENDRLGGTCLIRDCIPSKALIHAAKEFGIMTAAFNAPHCGINLESAPRVDFESAIKWKDEIVDGLSSGIPALLDRARVKHISGWARFTDGKSCVAATQAGELAITAELFPWDSAMPLIPTFAATRSDDGGTDEQKRRYLPSLISGQHVGSLRMSEAGAGSDVVSMKLRAERRGDRYVLNGTKFWITNARHADVFVVYAKTNPFVGAKGISSFLIEKETGGFSVSRKHEKLGMRGSDTAELVFEDCEIPDDQIMGDEGGRHRSPNVRLELRTNRARWRTPQYYAGMPGRGVPICS